MVDIGSVILIICLVVLGTLLGVSIFKRNENRCNSNYDIRENTLDEIEFKVTKIEETVTGNKHSSRWVAKYTIENFYMTGPNDVDNITLVFYDEIGKYQIGDKLRLTKIEYILR